MIQRKTQDPAYWSDKFAIVPKDLQYLSALLVEDELPRSVEELSRALVLHRSRQEETLIKRALSKGTLYQPKRSYEEGERVVFPALDYLVGKVVGVRSGRNPEYDSFQVIELAFEGGKQREFAAALESDHPLNQDSALEGDGLHSPEELALLYGPQIARVLEEHLESNPDFARLANKWFRRDLLVEVHEGHLNLAEAVLDIAGGGPLPTEALLGDLELPEEITAQLRVFSLNYALQQDERFDEVGPAGEVLWFLHRLEPESVRSIPPDLRYEPLEYEPPLLTSEMRALEQELDDEWSDFDIPAKVSEPVEVVLTYPHWISGTMPLSSRLARVFPTGRTHRIRFTFVDGDTGTEMPGWVIRENRYAYGLGEWYRENNLPVGTYLELARGEQPGTVVIRPRRRRTRREWVRVILSVDDQLAFEMRREVIPCAYDELMILAVGDPEELKAVRTRTREQRLPLSQLVDEIFSELVKLSPQGNVHAATLYSAINVAIRTPPGPMLEELVASGKYAPVGDNYWVLRIEPSGV